MKRSLFCLLFILSLSAAHTQNFTWLRGSQAKNVPGVYGSKGTMSNGNDPGGRHGSATWTDASGNLWLFGGEGYDSTHTICWMNDLWKYDVISNQWTWIRGSAAANALGIYGTQGVPSPTNEPGAREFPIFWTDASGNFWLFGGEGFGAVAITSAETLGDLWKYSPSTNQWTFVKGYTITNQPGVYGTKGTAAGTNLPPSRSGGGAWYDPAGKLWLFGGRGAFTGPNHLNDLWSYNPSTNDWTWVSGANTANQFTNHGTLGVANVANIPGAREFPGCWRDASGNLYLFGGKGRGASLLGWLSDMWKYDPTTNLWTWIHGSNLNNQQPVYGTKGTPSSATLPGARFASATWKDKDGNFWMFGGEGYAGSLGYLSDLFRYDPTNNQWTFMKGPTTANNTAIYGTKGVAHANNIPSGRFYNISWRETPEAFYILGGRGYDTLANIGDLNDLWRYVPPCNPDSVITTSASLCTGNSVTLTAYNQYNSAVQWFATPSGTSSIGSGSVFSTPVLTATSTQSVYSYYASSNNCTMYPRALVSITVNPLPKINVTGPASGCDGELVNLSATGASTYSWSNGASGSSVQVVLNGSPDPTLIVQATDLNGCKGSGSITIIVNPVPNLSISGPTAVCAGSPASFTATGAASYTWSHGSTLPTSSVIPSGPLYITTLLGTSPEGCENSTTYSTVVNPLPTVTASIKGPAKFCSGYTATITATGASSYVWSGGQTGSVIVVNPTVTTTYTVTGTDVNGCISPAMITQTTTICTGILQNENEFVSIFPNPSAGFVTIKLHEQVNNCSLLIINSLGEVVSEHVYISGQPVQVELPEGVYFFCLEHDGGITRKKVIIH